MKMMKTMIRRFQSTILVMLIALTAKASAGDTFTAATEEGVVMTFSVTDEENKTCQVGTGTESCVSPDTHGSLTILRYANGYEVTAIAPSAFLDCTHLTAVSLPDGITEIGFQAFSYCKSLEGIDLPDGLRRICAEAFIYSGIQEIRIPAGVTVIEGTPFPHVSVLTVADDNPVFCSPEGSNALIERATSMLVAGCGSTVIPQGVTAIGPFAFNHCMLNTIAIPESVTEIGTDAFYHSYLESIEIPHTVSNIGAHAFGNCGALKSVVLHEGTVSIGARCFRNCKSLLSISLPMSIRSLGRDVFQSCLALEEISIPEGVEEIPTAAFAGCTALCAIRLPESIKRIGEMAFYLCESLDSISLPSGLEEMGRAVFGDKPLSVYRLFCETPPTVDETTFMGNYESKLYVPEGTAGTYKATDIWKNFKDIVEFNTDRINDIGTQVRQESIHDLQGRRLISPPERGVYIQNGKKYVK